MFPSQVTMPVWHEKHLRAATHAAGVALWSWNVDTDAITMDEPAYDLWEVSKDEQDITFEILSRNIHPADLARVRSAFAATRAVIGAYEIDFRILSGSDIRWISARGQGDDADIADGLMFGVFLDVTQRKQAEEAKVARGRDEPPRHEPFTHSDGAYPNHLALRRDNSGYGP